MSMNCKKIKNKTNFSYDELIKNPHKEIDKVCKFLKLKKQQKQRNNCYCQN